jgi:recombination protein RecA
LASGNIVRNAQEMGIFVVLIDTENALDSDWLQALGVDTAEDKLLKINAAMVDDVAKIISDFMKDYKSSYREAKAEDRPKVLFVIDSLGMLMTPNDVNQFQAGEIKGDMGRKPKALKALVTNCVNMFGEYDIGLVATNHTYASQDQFNPDQVISGGSGPIFAASIVVSMNKLKLKEDEDGNKVSDVLGIRSKIQVAKSRYSKPFESVELKIPYETGMDPYTGLIDMFEKGGVLTKDGNKLKYIALDNTEHKYFRKQISKDLLDRIMQEYDERERLEEAKKLAQVQIEDQETDTEE